MNRRIGFAVAGFLAALPLAARADDAPARNAEVWGGEKHPPSVADLRQREQDDGVQEPGRGETDEVEQLARKITRNANTPHPGLDPSPDDGTLTR